ncbi:hypothetical protein AB1K91_07135 [Terribacillus sp. 179-K 1B1 HS]|uniref:hypothetical protein n=1 Tax=Terribacillus sp. 179-K 1B1 HS TaxID=3142388 RepID=UPI00399FE2EA
MAYQSGYNLHSYFRTLKIMYRDSQEIIALLENYEDILKAQAIDFMEIKNTMPAEGQMYERLIQFHNGASISLIWSLEKAKEIVKRDKKIKSNTH